MTTGKLEVRAAGEDSRARRGARPGARTSDGPEYKPRPLPHFMPFPRWVTSDHHFGHDAIARHCHRPDDHDQLMWDRWVEIVGESDVVLHLGDIALKPENVARWATELPGDVWMIPGNHDRARVLDAVRAAGWHVIWPFETVVDDWRVIFTHWPLPAELPHRTVNVHGHSHNNEPEYSLGHFNVCVENTDYAPVELLPLLRSRFADLRRERYRVLGAFDQ